MSGTRHYYCRSLTERTSAISSSGGERERERFCAVWPSRLRHLPFFFRLEAECVGEITVISYSFLFWSGLVCPLSGGWCNAGSGAGSRDQCGGAGEMVSGCHGTRPAPCFLHAPRFGERESSDLPLFFLAWRNSLRLWILWCPEVKNGI